MPREDNKTFVVEDAIIFRKNFTGREILPYNRAGSRNFLVGLTEDDARRMLKDGWNVKGIERLEDEEDDRGPFISVQVGFGSRPPLICLINSKGKRYLDEETVSILDSLDFATVDIMCRAHFWDRPNSERIKAYLKTMYVTIEEDFLQRKWAEDIEPTGDDD